MALKLDVAQLVAAVEAMAKSQAETSESLKDLTRVQTEHIKLITSFEGARADDHRRMDEFKTQLRELNGKVDHIKDDVLSNTLVTKAAQRFIWMVIGPVIVASVAGVIYAIKSS